MSQQPAPVSIETRLRQCGMRITPQRMAVAELMLSEPTHIKPQQAYELLHASLPSLSPNTIYLTLDHFEQAGLLRKIFIDGKAVFDSRTDRHDHAFCRKCHAIQDLPTRGIENTPLTLKRWRIDEESRVWSGVCPACASNTEES